ncbi:hypothetical protein GGF47_001005 [Coemansia sp. RSA 2524]|nr:hypothetical protein LPJ54_000961 [Coemansia sp. RSA 1824]KAJ2429022.1 hypothetical protein GGF47_001005 [Coemansia sp. RSA 2524]
MLFKIASIAALASSVAAHMDMTEPCSRFSPYCATRPPLPAGILDYDYSIDNPIPYNGSVFKSEIQWTKPVASWTAGQPVTIKFRPGGAAHSGGHCQFAISYDNGKTAAVVHEVMKHCFFNGPSNSNVADVLEYTFDLPADIPASSNAQFIWIWNNAIGNRELYTGIADITIANSGGSKSYTGKSAIYPNHEGYGSIPEFNGNYNTGLSLFENAPNVVVSPGDSAAPPPVPEYSSSAVESKTVAPPAESKTVAPPVGHTPTSQSSAEPTFEVTATGPPAESTVEVTATKHLTDSVYTSSAPTAAPTGSACTHGALQCISGNAGFQECVWGVWSATFACGPGTVCQQTSPDAVVCGWA